MIIERKNPLPVAVKNLLAHTVKTVRVLQAYRVKVKRRKLVRIDLEVIRLKKVIMLANQNSLNRLVLEILTPIHHVAFAVVSN